MTRSSSLTWLTLCLALSACGSPRVRPDAASVTAASGAGGPPTRVEIGYVLGHTSRRFVAELKDSSPEAVAQIYMDRILVSEATVDTAKYREFLAKASEFVDRYKREPASESADACRNPYTISLFSGAPSPAQPSQAMQPSKSITGCRTAGNGDSAHIGRLIRDGELLLYSGNPPGSVSK